MSQGTAPGTRGPGTAKCPERGRRRGGREGLRSRLQLRGAGDPTLVPTHPLPDLGGSASPPQGSCEGS